MVKRPKQIKLNWKNKPKRCRKCAATTFLSSCPSCGEKGTVDVECPFCNEWHGYTTILQHMRAKHNNDNIPAPVARKKKKDGTIVGTGSGNQSPSSEPGSFYTSSSSNVGNALSGSMSNGIKKQKKIRSTIPYTPTNRQLREILAITASSSSSPSLHTAGNNNSASSSSSSSLSLGEPISSNSNSNNSLYIKLTILATAPFQHQQQSQQLFERISVKKLITLDNDASFAQFLDIVSDTIKHKVSCNFISSKFEYTTPAHLVKQLAAFNLSQQQQQQQQQLISIASKNTSTCSSEVSSSHVVVPSVAIKQEQSSPPTVLLPHITSSNGHTMSSSPFAGNKIAAQGVQQSQLNAAGRTGLPQQQQQQQQLSADDEMQQQELQDDDDNDENVDDSDDALGGKPSMIIADDADNYQGSNGNATNGSTITTNSTVSGMLINGDSSTNSATSGSTNAIKVESIEFEADEKGEFIGIESEAEWELAMAMPIELKMQKLHIRVHLSVM